TFSSPRRNDPRMRCLVSWSSATTPTLIHSQRYQPGAVVCASRMAASLSCAEEVGDATRAQSRLSRIRPDVAAPVPAALALAVGARPHLDGERVAVAHARGGGDHHEAQVVAEARERS